jgi:hypothetical protein
MTDLKHFKGAHSSTRVKRQLAKFSGSRSPISQSNVIQELSQNISSGKSSSLANTATSKPKIGKNHMRMPKPLSNISSIDFGSESDKKKRKRHKFKDIDDSDNDDECIMQSVLKILRKENSCSAKVRMKKRVRKRNRISQVITSDSEEEITESHRGQRKVNQQKEFNWFGDEEIEDFLFDANGYPITWISPLLDVNGEPIGGTGMLINQSGIQVMWNSLFFDFNRKIVRKRQHQAFVNGEIVHGIESLFDSHEKPLKLFHCASSTRALTDSTGKRIEDLSHIFDSFGKPISWKDALFDAQSNPIIGTGTLFDSKGTPISWTGSLYNPGGLPVSEADSLFDEEGEILRWKYAIKDDQNNPIPGTGVLLTPNGRVVSWTWDTEFGINILISTNKKTSESF